MFKLCVCILIQFSCEVPIAIRHSRCPAQHHLVTTTAAAHVISYSTHILETACTQLYDPRPLPPPCTIHAAFQRLIDVFRRCARDIDILSFCTAASTRLSFHVLLDLRVPYCGLCCWICVFHIVVCAVGYACSMLWFVLLDICVPYCGLCC